MQRSVLFVLLLILVLLALGPTGCGGNNTGVGAASAVTVTPSPVSMNLSQTLQVTATVTDAASHQLTTEIVSFTSSNSGVFTTTSTGLLCAGTWDTNFVHCVPGSAGTATLTAKTSPSGLTTTVAVFVHPKADSIIVGEISPIAVPLACGVPAGPGSGCISMGAIAPNNAESYTAIACSSDPAICGANPVPCQLPNNVIGAFQFASSNPSVATVAADTNNPNTVTVATAKGPGISQITATLSGTNSLPATFTTCPPDSIIIHASGQPATATTVSIAKAATSTLAADVLDTKGVAMTGLPLAWTTSLSAVATVNSTAVVTGVAPGTSNIVAACSAPFCNVGTKEALFSNVVTATVTGTANATTVYATSSDAGTTIIIPISTSTNTAGTAINLPGGFSAPNSFVFAPTGLKAFLGSDSGLMVFDPVAGTVTGVAGAPGKILAVSNDGAEVVVADTTAPNKLYIYNSSSGVVGTFTIAGATGADLTPEDSHVFIASAGPDLVTIFGINISNSLPASGPPSAIALLANGAFAYVGDTTTDVFSTCTGALAGNVGLSSTLIKAAAKPVPAPNNTNLQMIAVTGNQITQIDAVPGALGAPCPAIPTNTASAHSFPGVPAFTPVQLLVTPDSSKAIVTASDVAQLLVYSIGTDAPSGVTSTIPLFGAATGAYTGGVTVDSSTVWVGAAGVNQVQGFTLSSGAPVAQITMGFAPKLVAVRYQ